MGAGVVYRSGLENLAGNTQETAETADLCGSQDAPEALFAACSAAGDGNNVGTYLIDLSDIDPDLRAALDATEFHDEDDWLAPPHSGYGYCIYEPVRFLAYLERFGMLCGRPLDPPVYSPASVLPGDLRYTYFARGTETGRIKIGLSRSPEYRVSQLQHCNNGEAARPLAIIRGNFEKSYHRAFQRWHEGNEWFAPHPDILAEVEHLARPDAQTQGVSNGQ